LNTTTDTDTDKYNIFSNKVQHIQGSNWQTPQSRTVWWNT